MPELVRIVDGRVATQLPEVGELSDGRRVSGYDHLPEEVLREEGWVELEDDGPPALEGRVIDYEREIVVEGGEPVVRYRPRYADPEAYVEGNTVVVLTDHHGVITFFVNGTSFVVEVTDGSAELEIDSGGEPAVYDIYVEEIDVTLKMEITHGS